VDSTNSADLHLHVDASTDRTSPPVTRAQIHKRSYDNLATIL